MVLCGVVDLLPVSLSPSLPVNGLKVIHKVLLLLVKVNVQPNSSVEQPYHLYSSLTGCIETYEIDRPSSILSGATIVSKLWFLDRLVFGRANARYIRLEFPTSQFCPSRCQRRARDLFRRDLLNSDRPPSS